MEQENPRPTKKSIATKIIACAIIVASLGILGGAVYTLLNPNGPETEQGNQNSVVAMNSEGVDPATITIKKGQSITWLNQSDTPRQIVLATVNPPQELSGFGSDGTILKDETYSFTFDAVGTFTYEDPSSPDVINGTITVEQ